MSLLTLPPNIKVRNYKVLQFALNYIFAGKYICYNKDVKVDEVEVRMSAVPYNNEQSQHVLDSSANSQSEDEFADAHYLR